MSPTEALALNLLVLLVFALLYFGACWLIARRLDNWSIVDVAWAFGFALAGAWILSVHASGHRLGGQGLLMAVATIAWSLRLGTHLAVRVLGHLDREDGRYLRMRAEWGASTPAKMATFYLLQAVALALLCLPLLSAAGPETLTPLRPIHLAGLAVVVLALAGEAVADAQLAAFKGSPENKGAVCDRGLWSWSRHPNYFCEWLIWAGFALMSYNDAFRGIPGLLCAGIMYHLLTKVTGVPMTEQQLLASKGEAYARYQARVSAFWPRPPKA